MAAINIPKIHFHNIFVVVLLKAMELETFLNNVKTKQNISININQTFKELASKIHRFTRAKYQLQILVKDGLEYEKLTSQNYDQIVANRPVKLNINTQLKQKPEDSSKSPEIVQKKSGVKANVQSPDKSARNNLKQMKLQAKVKKQSSQVSKSKSKLDLRIQQKPIIQTFNHKIITEEVKARNKFEATIESINKKIQHLHIKQTEQQAEQKIPEPLKQQVFHRLCSQCGTLCRGCYYLCLVCKPQILLCSECESKEDISQLKSHQFPAHPFVKIKRWTQQIKSINIELEEKGLQSQTTKQKIENKQQQLSMAENLIRFALQCVIKSLQIKSTLQKNPTPQKIESKHVNQMN